MDWLCNMTFLLVFTVGALIKCTVQDLTIEPVVPTTVEACLGSDATINCTFTTNSNDIKTKWFFNSPNSTELNISNGHYDFSQEKTWMALIIKGVTFNDSGLYFCKVIQDIPVLSENYSNGSQLIVIDSFTTSSPERNATAAAATFCATMTGSDFSPDWLVWTGLALGGVALVITIAIIWCIKRKRKDDRVYININRRAQKDHSPRPGLSKEKGKIYKQTDTPKSSNYTSRPRGRPTNI